MACSMLGGTPMWSSMDHRYSCDTLGNAAEKSNNNSAPSGSVRDLILVAVSMS